MKKIVIFLIVALLTVSLMPTAVSGVSAEETQSKIYESFDDYETAPNRAGVAGGIFTQMASWSGNAATFEASVGEPIGATSGKALKLTSKGNQTLNIWGNGTTDTTKIDQTGAKYAKIHVRSKNAKVQELGFYITDILQSTVDSWTLPENSGKIKDSGQEHWSIKWNKTVVLESATGEKTAATSTKGSSISIPAGFEGSVNIPLNTKTLENPSWFLAQPNVDYINRQIDLGRIFSVSFYFPETTGVTSTDPSTHIAFEVDNVMFLRDNEVDEFLAKQDSANALEAAEAIRPINSDIKIDHTNGTITLQAEVTRKEFVESFSLKKGYEIVIKDDAGFEITSDTAKVPADAEATFTDKVKPFTYTVKYPSTTSKPAPSCGGCGSVVFNGGLASGIALACLAIVLLVLIRRKSNEKKI